MVVIKNVIASKEATFLRSKEVFLHKTFTVAATLHITGNVQGIRRIQPGQDIPPHVQLVAQIGRIGHHLIYLGFHKVRIPILIHISYIVEIKQRHVEGLWPRFKLRSSHSLAESIVKPRKTLERLFPEQGKRTQLIFQDGPVRIGGIRTGGGAAFGFRVRVACRRAFQQHLVQHLPNSSFRGLVILAVAYAETLLPHIRLIALGFGFIAQFLLFLVRGHRKIVLEHILGQVRETALFQKQVIGGFHIGALGGAVVAKVHGNVETEAIVQELVQAQIQISCHIQLGGGIRKFRLRRASCR